MKELGFQVGDIVVNSIDVEGRQSLVEDIGLITKIDPVGDSFLISIIPLISDAHAAMASSYAELGENARTENDYELSEEDFDCSRMKTVSGDKCKKVSEADPATLREVMARQISESVRHYEQVCSSEAEFVAGTSSIPASGKVLGAEEKCNMVSASLDGWLTAGRFNDEFEAHLRDFLGAKHVLTVNSGSSANLVALSALTSPRLADRAIKAGDEVITVAAGFPTTINPIMQCGAIPVFIDVELETYNIDASQIERAITSKTRAIMLAHTLGNAFNLKIISELCERHKLWLVEDCCDALGTEYEGKRVGTFGDIGTLSFYPAHHITVGEGGAVFTNSGKLKPILESFRDWGRDCFCRPGEDNTCGKRFDWKLGQLPEGYDHKYIYSHMGYNLKITDMQAACGVAQMNRLRAFIEARKRNFGFLYDALRPLENELLLPKATPGCNPSWFGFPITLRGDKHSRRNLLKMLDANKIGSRLLFAGNVVKQPYMEGKQYRVHGVLENTEKIMRDAFWIGIYPGLTHEMLEFSAKTISSYFSRIPTK